MLYAITRIIEKDMLRKSLLTDQEDTQASYLLQHPYRIRLRIMSINKLSIYLAIHSTIRCSLLVLDVILMEATCQPRMPCIRRLVALLVVMLLLHTSLTAVIASLHINISKATPHILAKTTASLPDNTHHNIRAAAILAQAALHLLADLAVHHHMLLTVASEDLHLLLLDGAALHHLVKAGTLTQPMVAVQVHVLEHNMSSHIRDKEIKEDIQVATGQPINRPRLAGGRIAE
jgi:hypothetical protein